jgi:hypothetical protein
VTANSPSSGSATPLLSRPAGRRKGGGASRLAISDEIAVLDQPSPSTDVSDL